MTGPDPERTLVRDLLLFMRVGDSAPTGDGGRMGESGLRFDELALRILRRQARHNPVCAALVRAHGLDPDRLERWQEFPPVPVRAFRSHTVYCGDPERAEARFLTSGTTGGGDRGLHPVRDLELYRSALLIQGERYLAHPAPKRVLALLPAPDDRPDSSLVHMADQFRRHWDDGPGGFFANADWALDMDGFQRALERAASDDVPTLLLGTAFAWVHWLDRAAERGDPPLTLPEGSSVMETGGFKGRSRSVPRRELYRALGERLGLPTHRIVNEYGMTEMLSQFWEPVLLEPDPKGGRVHHGPFWVRTRVLDPETLEPVPDGEPGLLCHLDLANIHSASLLLTEDRGIARGSAPGGGPAIELLGRSPGAEPRGCSLVMEQLLDATRPRPEEGPAGASGG